MDPPCCTSSSDDDIHSCGLHDISFTPIAIEYGHDYSALLKDEKDTSSDLTSAAGDCYLLPIVSEDPDSIDYILLDSGYSRSFVNILDAACIPHPLSQAWCPLPSQSPSRRRITGIIISHDDRDHVGGFELLLCLASGQTPFQMFANGQTQIDKAWTKWKINQNLFQWQLAAYELLKDVKWIVSGQKLWEKANRIVPPDCISSAPVDPIAIVRHVYRMSGETVIIAKFSSPNNFLFNSSYWNSFVDKVPSSMEKLSLQIETIGPNPPLPKPPQLYQYTINLSRPQHKQLPFLHLSTPNIPDKPHRDEDGEDDEDNENNENDEDNHQGPNSPLDYHIDLLYKLKPGMSMTPVWEVDKSTGGNDECPLILYIGNIGNNKYHYLFGLDSVYTKTHEIIDLLPKNDTMYQLLRRLLATYQLEFFHYLEYLYHTSTIILYQQRLKASHQTYLDAQKTFNIKQKDEAKKINQLTATKATKAKTKETKPTYQTNWENAQELASRFFEHFTTKIQFLLKFHVKIFPLIQSLFQWAKQKDTTDTSALGNLCVGWKNNLKKWDCFQLFHHGSIKNVYNYPSNTKIDADEKGLTTFLSKNAQKYWVTGAATSYHCDHQIVKLLQDKKIPCDIAYLHWSQKSTAPPSMNCWFHYFPSNPTLPEDEKNLLHFSIPQRILPNLTNTPVWDLLWQIDQLKYYQILDRCSFELTESESATTVGLSIDKSEIKTFYLPYSLACIQTDFKDICKKE